VLIAIADCWFLGSCAIFYLTIGIQRQKWVSKSSGVLGTPASWTTAEKRPPFRNGQDWRRAALAAGWLKHVSNSKVSFDIGKLQLKPSRCDTRVTPEEKRSFLVERAQETEQRRAFLNAVTNAEENLACFQNIFHVQLLNSSHLRGG